MKARELREKNVDELNRLLAERRDELFHLRMKAMAGQEVKSNRAGSMRKDIARILTLLNEREKVKTDKQEKEG